jgi:hypothetical protein
VGAVLLANLEWFGKPICPDLLLDHVIGGGQQRFRDGKADRLGGLEIDPRGNRPRSGYLLFTYLAKPRSQMAASQRARKLRRLLPSSLSL